MQRLVILLIIVAFIGTTTSLNPYVADEPLSPPAWMNSNEALKKINEVVSKICRGFLVPFDDGWKHYRPGDCQVFCGNVFGSYSVLEPVPRGTQCGLDRVCQGSGNCIKSQDA